MIAFLQINIISDEFTVTLYKDDRWPVSTSIIRNDCLYLYVNNDVFLNASDLIQSTPCYTLELPYLLNNI